MNEINKPIIYEAADQQSQNNEIIEMNNKSSTYTKEVSKEYIRNKVINWLKIFGTKIIQGFKKEEYGKVIILIGQKKTGKSETVKALCKHLPCDKYIIKFDKDLIPTEIPEDDKKDWKKIPGCHLIENEKQFIQASGLLILEDFPLLGSKGEQTIYNILKDSRHKGYQANYLIIVHNHEVIKNTVFDFANAILIYQDAPIRPQQLSPKVGGLSNGFAIDRAKNDLKEYHYIYISLDNKKWANPFIDSRDINILKKALIGKLKTSELKDIHYPKKSNRLAKPKEKTKREKIEQMIVEGYSQKQILDVIDTTEAYIWKVKVYMRIRYIQKYGREDFPYYLRDNRRKKFQKKELIEEIIIWE